jgi:four helix bundle protein
MRNFREYDIWKSAIEIAKEIYLLTEQFPNAEKYGLVSQIQRAAVSIASNIAEGASRESEKEFSHYLQIALGSAFEVETQLIIAQEIVYIKAEDSIKLLEKLQTLQKQISALITKIKH